ncbi:MAG: glycosyltransferase family 8 protein [Bacteroidales bacterium]|nr:glycosyltransferase family 8 protein [Bacteroidales bacterium]
MTPIVIAYTPNYFVPAATTLKSILDSSLEEARYEIICLVSEDIPDRMKEKLERMAGERMTFRYLNLKGCLGEGAYVDERYSEAASYRLVLPEILSELDSVVYIDCDIIVRNDIDALYRSTDLGDNYLAAVFEAPIESQAERFAALGCNPKRYFNSGFLIMNLRKMREDDVSRRLLEGLKCDYLEFPDQDVLNIVCKDKVLALSPTYNSIRTFNIPAYKKEFLAVYSEDDWKAVAEHGTVHYTGGKPWKMFSIKFGEWWETYFTLPTEIRSEWKPDRKIYMLAKFYRTLIGKFVLDSARKIKQIR